MNNIQQQHYRLRRILANVATSEELRATAEKALKELEKKYPELKELNYV